MQPLRRWVPGPSRNSDSCGPRLALACKDEMIPADIPGKDIAFCAEFAVHGGVAVSKQGFVKAETELLRMQQAGLLDLIRDAAPPFAVIRVTLSAAARGLLSGEQHVPSALAPAFQTMPVSGGAMETKYDTSARRNGFEVARGMIGAVIKAELSSCTADQAPQYIAALELRVMNRVSQIHAPF